MSHVFQGCNSDTCVPHRLLDVGVHCMIRHLMCVVVARLEQPGRLQAVLSELLDFGPVPAGPTDFVADMEAELAEMSRACTHTY